MIRHSEHAPDPDGRCLTELPDRLAAVIATFSVLSLAPCVKIWDLDLASIDVSPNIFVPIPLLIFLTNLVDINLG